MAPIRATYLLAALGNAAQSRANINLADVQDENSSLDLYFALPQCWRRKQWFSTPVKDDIRLNNREFSSWHRRALPSRRWFGS
ncbi:MAG: hypothetical protein ACLFU3_02390, partial [Dichotomicrobium sp.]